MDGPTTVDLRDLRAKLRAAHPYKDTLQAAERVIDAEHRFLEGNVPVSSRLWQEVVMLLVARVLQLQRAVVDAVTIGYDEEVQPIARATASAVVTMTAIGHGNRLVDRDRKAVRYIAFADRARRRQARYLAQSRWISRQARLASDAEAQAETKDLLDRAAKDGITPLCMGPQEKRFWSGYDDRTLFKKMGVLRWYEHFYAPWSEASHGQPRGLVHVSEQYASTNAFEIGPHQRSPWFLLLATSEFGFQSLVQVNKCHRLRRRAELVTLWHEIQTWFHDAAVSEQRVESETHRKPKS